MRKILFFIIVFASTIAWTQTNTPKAGELISQMIEKNKQVNTLSLHTLMNERIDGKMIDKDSYFKINVKPRKVFVLQSFIGITLEGLYAEGTNENMLLIATKGFPWVQLNLDPRGSTVRKDHHHTIFEAGFGYFISVVSTLKTIKGETFDQICKYEGKVFKNKSMCHKVIIDNSNFAYIDYTVKQGETLPTIAEKLLINDYMILEINKNIDDFNDVKAGQKIKVPNAYCKKLILYLDINLMLPINIEVYDDKGLYATYEYYNLKVNPTFAPDEFNRKFKDYHFR